MMADKQEERLLKHEEITADLIKKVIKSVQKKAMGYNTEEIIEEYTHDENLQKEVLVKKKVSKYKVPADISAAKFLIELACDKSQTQFENLSDEELDVQAIKLFEEYQKLSGKEIFLKGENDGNK